MPASEPTPASPAVLVTGASSGIGAVYADRFARRGHDLVLVARDLGRLETLAASLRRDAGVKIDVIRADLTLEHDLQSVEARLRDDRSIGVLVNNAGMSLHGGFLEQNAREITQLIALNVTALTRLANAVAPTLVQSGAGAIINIGSVVGFVPEFGMSAYAGSKAFVQVLSQGLAIELGPRGVYVQAVLPSATRTEIWQRSGRDVEALDAVMSAEDLVDAALVGFDRREAVTIPPLPEAAQWDAFEAARQAMLPNLAQAAPAERYRPRAVSQT